MGWGGTPWTLVKGNPDTAATILSGGFYPEGLPVTGGRLMLFRGVLEREFAEPLGGAGSTIFVGFYLHDNATYADGRGFGLYDGDKPKLVLRRDSKSQEKAWGVTADGSSGDYLWDEQESSTPAYFILKIEQTEEKATVQLARITGDLPTSGGEPGYDYEVELPTFTFDRLRLMVAEKANTFEDSVGYFDEIRVADSFDSLFADPAATEN